MEDPLGKKNKREYQFVTVNIGVRMPAQVKDAIETWLENHQDNMPPKTDGKPWTIGDIMIAHCEQMLKSEYQAILKQEKTTESGIEIIEQDRRILTPGEAARGEGSSLLYGPDGNPLR